MKLRIADLIMDVACGDETAESLPNLSPFLVSDENTGGQPVICHIRTGIRLSPEKASPTLVNTLDEKTLSLWVMPDHCSISLTFHTEKCTCRLRADRQWRCIETDWRPADAASFAVLNDFIMVAFVYSSAFHHTVSIHASCIHIGDNGCAFIGPSGIGKSTHSRLWLEHIPGACLLNDDQPVLRLMPGDEIRLSGSPWSGKTPCYQNRNVRLKAVFFMEQADENSVVRLDGIETFRKLLKATSLIGRDTASFKAISETQARVSGTVPAYVLRNCPDKEAALLSYQTFMSV